MSLENMVKVEADVIMLTEGRIDMTETGEVMEIHRGRRARHVHERGSPGTWEASLFPVS